MLWLINEPIVPDIQFRSIVFYILLHYNRLKVSTRTGYQCINRYLFREFHLLYSSLFLIYSRLPLKAKHIHRYNHSLESSIKTDSLFSRNKNKLLENNKTRRSSKKY